MFDYFTFLLLLRVKLTLRNYHLTDRGSSEVDVTDVAVISFRFRFFGILVNCTDHKGVLHFQNAGAKAACDALQVDYGTKYEHGSIANIICKFHFLSRNVMFRSCRVLLMWFILSVARFYIVQTVGFPV